MSWVSTDFVSDSVRDAQEGFYDTWNSEVSGYYDGGRCFCVVEDNVFATYDEALAYARGLSERSRQGDVTDYCVPFWRVVETSEMRRLSERISRMESDYRAYVQKNGTLAGRKSQFVGCKECGSSIAIERYLSRYNNPTQCPVCRASLLSNTYNERVEKYNVDLKELRKRYAEAERKLASKRGLNKCKVRPSDVQWACYGRFYLG